MEYAGFWRRFVAYWIDALPITGGVFLVFYFGFGFDATVERYFNRKPDDLAAVAEFKFTRGLIRNLAMGTYLAYCAVLEASALRGTVGKWAVGIEVVDADGEPLTYAQSARRNASKFVSFLAFGVGCLAVTWTPRGQGWHDRIAGTYVVYRRRTGVEASNPFTPRRFD